MVDFVSGVYGHGGVVESSMAHSLDGYIQVHGKGYLIAGLNEDTAHTWASLWDYITFAYLNGNIPVFGTMLCPCDESLKVVCR
jgi:hypothetical protein